MPEREVVVTLVTKRWHGPPEDRKSVERQIRREGKAAEVTLAAGEREVLVTMTDDGTVAVWVHEGSRDLLDQVVTP